MKKIVILGAATLISLAIFAPPAFAQVPTIIIDDPGVGFTDIGDILSTLIKYAILFAVVACILFIIMGAFGYLTAGDDVKKTEGARKTITNAVIGLIIAVSIWGIMKLMVAIIPGLGSILPI